MGVQERVDEIRTVRADGGRTVETVRTALARVSLRRRSRRPCQPAPRLPAAVSTVWPSAPQSAGRARRFLVERLALWGLADLADSAGLVLSELVTNAVRHGVSPHGCVIATRFERVESGVRIEVRDLGDGEPVRRDAAADAESGRGLALVDALTGGRWGVVDDGDGPGKAVWAVCVEDGTEEAK